MEKQVKSKQRVADHGEVFTAEREVNAMLDLVKQETERINSRFLEPACGDGNFLSEILRRKLAVVKRSYGKSPADYERYAVMAVMSIYGVELLQDNADACRARLFEIWNKEYTANCKKEANDACRDAVRFVLSRNILCGNALSLMCVDEHTNDTDTPIIFSAWEFVSETMVKRRDYRLDVLPQENPEPDHSSAQQSLFGDDAMAQDNWMIDPVTQEVRPKPVREFPATSYRRIAQDA